MRYLASYVAAATAFIVLDLIWLGALAGNTYRMQMGNLLAPHINYVSAAAFYLLFVAGLVILAVEPAVGAGSAAKAALLGAVFGLCCYGTYNLTAIAVIRGFPVPVAMLDMAWGTGAAAALALLSYFVAMRL